MRSFLLLFASALILVSCGGNETAKNDEPTTPNTQNDTVPEKQPEYPSDPKFDAFAKYISGIEGPADSELKGLESLPAWQAYKTNLESLWKQTNAKLPVIKDWTAAEMSEANSGGGTLFYPFSGADFLHADLFFPEHDHIVMLALEPIGKFPDLNEKKKDETLSPYLNSLKKAMNAILKLSFFRTIAMADDFQSEMDGTLHVISHFISRTGHELMYQEQVAILPDGTLTNEVENLPDSTYIGNRFYLKDPGSDKVRTVCYFQVNIQNTAYGSRGGFYSEGLEKRKDLLNYFKGLNIKSTYIKSASYLMHRPSFSMIRDLILAESEYLLQDDSGIPVQYFDQAKWDLTFYGTYSFPISLFAERHQEDLKEIYQKKELPVKPLPFGIGYQYRKGTSNLMLAKKK